MLCLALAYLCGCRACFACPEGKLTRQRLISAWRILGRAQSCQGSPSKQLLSRRWERCETAAQEDEGPPGDESQMDGADSQAAPAPAAAALTSEEAKASGRQIFSTREAYGMLSCELLDIFQQRGSISVSAVDDSVYHWGVTLSEFHPSSPLAQACPFLVGEVRLFPVP